jgi:hypothetical protein
MQPINSQYISPHFPPVTPSPLTPSIHLTIHEVNGAYVSLVLRKYTLSRSLLMSYIYGAPCKARNFNVVDIWTYV